MQICKSIYNNQGKQDAHNYGIQCLYDFFTKNCSSFIEKIGFFLNIGAYAKAYKIANNFHPNNLLNFVNKNVFNLAGPNTILSLRGFYYFINKNKTLCFSL